MSDFAFVYFGKTLVPYPWLLNAALVFTLSVVSMLLFIFFFLHQKRKEQQKKKGLRLLFSDLIAETVVGETEQEVQEVLQQFLAKNASLLQKPLARRLLIQEIVKTKDSISGRSAGNLRVLFEGLALDKDCLAQFSSGKWHHKAGAIQHLAEMQQSKYLVKIYRETNNRNNFIRTEAQIAVVKLTGFKGLRFLNIISYPVSQWQQLSLLNQLQDSEVEEEKIKPWLFSKNETVTEFALRLIEIYKCFDLHDVVVQCLQHQSLSVRLQALQALKEMGNDSTPAALVKHFSIASKQEQTEIINILGETGGNSHLVDFLTSLLQHEEEAIRYHAMLAIKRISPVWSTIVMKQMKNDPSFTNILSTLEKEAV
jgi:hypothetical protein